MYLPLFASGTPSKSPSDAIRAGTERAGSLSSGSGAASRPVWALCRIRNNRRGRRRNRRQLAVVRGEALDDVYVLKAERYIDPTIPCLRLRCVARLYSDASFKDVGTSVELVRHGSHAR